MKQKLKAGCDIARAGALLYTRKEKGDFLCSH